MLNLFLSFLIAVSSAVGLVGLSHIMAMDVYTSRIFPLIPLLYAITYQLLERLKTGNTKPVHPEKMKEDIKAGVRVIFQHITIGRIFTAMAISFCIKLVFEIYLLSLFLHFNRTSFTALYGGFSIETVSRFLRGEHPWLMGSEGLYLLMLLALTTSLGTGLWIGYTTKSGPGAVLEGVLAGAVVTIFTALTNMLILYQKIEEMANQMAASMGYGMRIGFIAVLSLQVLLYGFWSGIAQKAKYQRAERRATKKLAKRSR
ncbi:MAG: hypothetical protein A3G39_02030 [Deltaproteobacteria bacterium RIFCSPLOWO2_12_FULL_43_16]|nr:MAG: hypothetical protein A2Z89_04780 [Deltaproteobacteria bacterium GWA2_43_19]OGQ12868.1 MAG: hypothetical protein A3D30_01665 [Deltaproteobacteria bacterium RIFCSPHIGHO2_02_FULL_43_33]OGQ57233.1 MAG: hypothetical protein A3G39_02030 [Deltaproteobacteria bacterium RIFCSPLOWO2_12_FULL_43_16]HBR17873.1 hypothetical protein [Deltaproteobacteria bacterium]